MKLKNLKLYLRYDWPLHFILLLTNWLPDNVVFMRLRGWLLRPFFAKCGSNLEVGRNVTFQNPSKIHLGRDIYVAYGSCFLAGTEIYVGDEVMFGPYCVVVSANHTRLGYSYHYGAPDMQTIHIGNGCWLASHVIVVPGTTIGDGSCVAAGAAARGMIASNVMVGGVPTAVIRNLES